MAVRRAVELDPALCDRYLKPLEDELAGTS